MSPKRDSPEAPHFSLLGVHMVRSEEVFGRGTTIIVFFDGTSSNF